jgi:protease I
MSDKKLLNKKIAILATDGFEQSELLEPKKALENAGAKVDIVSLKAGSIKSWSKRNWGPSVEVDVVVSEANPDNYQGLVLPGGTLNPDRLRMDPDAVAFVSEFTRTGKPIAAICHGPWTLIETDILDGRTVTSWPSLKTDLINAGAKWIDKAVVVDNGLITSRNPDDLPAFNEKIIEEFKEGKHEAMGSLKSNMTAKENLHEGQTPSTLH